jgi:hypothetical protein
VLANKAGTWTVWTRPYPGLKGTVGPGYVGRALLRDGTRLCEGDTTPVGTSGNDPRWQGIGGVGWHHFRAIPSDDPNIWNKGWDFASHRIAALPDPFGVTDCRVTHLLSTADLVQLKVEVDFVDRYSHADGKRVMLASYDYKLTADALAVSVTMTQFPDGEDSGPAAFVKEPKLLVGVAPKVGGGAVFDGLDVLDAAGKRLGIHHALQIGDPSKKTLQLGHARRDTLRLNAKGWNLDVRAQAADRLSAGRPWAGSEFGLDAWAAAANGRPSFFPEPCPAYCLQGPGKSLTRNWEVAKRPKEPQVGLMFHGWEGGYGLPDCLCCARAFQPGESWSALLTVGVRR